MSHRPHGSRAKYVVERCCCADCSAANRAYARYQAKRKSLEALGRPSGPWAPPFVDARPVLEHVRALGALGVGYKRVAVLAGVSSTAIAEILAGRRRVRRETAAKVLSVPLTPDVAGGQLVAAEETWETVDRILRDSGWTKGRLARELGAQRAALQIGRSRVLASTAAKVAELGHRMCVDL